MHSKGLRALSLLTAGVVGLTLAAVGGNGSLPV